MHPIFRHHASNRCIYRTFKNLYNIAISTSRIEISTSENLQQPIQKLTFDFQDWDFDFREPSKTSVKVAISTSGIEISTSENLQKPMQKLQFRLPGLRFRLLTVMAFCDHSQAKLRFRLFSPVRHL